MLYLLFRIMVFLISAAILGFGVGWYVRQVSAAKREAEMQKQLNSARSVVPQLEISIKSRDVDCERLRGELADIEKKFALAGTVIEKRDHEMLERDRKIASLNNSMEILKSSPASEYMEQSGITREDLSEKDDALRDQKKLLAQLEARLDVQDKLISEAGIREEAEAAEIASMENRYARQITTLEEMLSEQQSQVASYVSAQNEKREHIQGLSDEILELRSAESQHEGEMTRLEEELAGDKRSLLALEQELENALEFSREVERLEVALEKMRSDSDSRAELAERELADIQAKLQEQTDVLSLLEKRNAGLEDQLTRSRQAQLKLATGYNEGIEARKQLQALQEESAQQQKSLPVEPSQLYEELPASVDNLKQIKGLGIAAEKQLNGVGIYQFQQIAAFDEANVNWVENQLKKLSGRFQRDDWIAQAIELAKTTPHLLQNKPSQDSDPAYH